jgi:type IV pilus assembly protein PilM
MANKIYLYLEDTEVKILVADTGKVISWASVPLEKGLIKEGLILDIPKVAKTIKDAIDLQSIKEKTVVAGLSGLNSISRIISIPEVPKGLMAEAIANEASRVLPMPLSQVYIAHQSIPGSKGETRLFLTAYPKHSTDALLTAIRDAGLKTVSMDIAPLALARCVNASQAILVHSWLNHADIVILSDRIPLVVRSIALPTETTSVEEKLQAVTEEVNRTITFYNSNFPDQALPKSTNIFLGGDISRDKKAFMVLGELGHPVVVIKPEISASDVFDFARYAINVGLALKGQTNKGESDYHSIIDFNALPGAYQAPTFKLHRVLLPVGVVIGISALIYGGFALYSLHKETDTLERQYNQLEAQKNTKHNENAKIQLSITAQNSNSEAISAQCDNIQVQIDSSTANQAFFAGILNDVKAGLVDCGLNLGETINDIPAGVNVNSIEYDFDSITLKGTGTSSTVVFNYARNLRASGRFNTVSVSSIATADNLAYSFVIVLY